jgi:hypothetical protein
LHAQASFLVVFDTTTGSRAIQPTKINQLIDLLEDSSNLAEAGLVLKAHGIPFTGTWDKVRERILPAVKDGKLPISALVALLRNSEEYGGQHVFVYDTTKVNASALVNDDTLKSKLTSLGREDLLKEPDLLSKAGSRALADARIETSSTGRTLVLKAVEARAFYKLETQYPEDGGRYQIKRYKRHEVRAVDVLRVHSDGFAEMRIHAHDSSNDYSDHVTKAWHFFAHFVSRFQFKDKSISVAQQELWKNRSALKQVLRYSDSRLRDTKGAVLTAATGAQQDSLFDNEKASKSIDAFWDDDTVCDKSNVWWLKTSDEPTSVPSRPIHVVMSGASNEFTVPGKCNKEDFDYVLAQIRKANK